MISSTEDELLATLTWLDDSYTLDEFINEFPLPQVVKVVRGHDGGTDATTLGYGEVLTIHALRETRVLVAETKSGDPFSVGLDFPDEFQILPQVTDSSLISCEVTDFASFYQTVKFVEVIQAHYGTGDDVDSTSQGEILEILDINKPNKPDKIKVHVRNVENDEKSTLTATCSAIFRPLLDWRKYKAPQLKTHQFGFPVRVRFMDSEIGRDDTEYHRFISKNPDVNIMKETRDVIVITSSVSSEAEYKFCFEVPKELEVKVAVADGFYSGAKHYTDIVTTLNQRFDVTKFMANHQPPLIKRRDAIKRYDYDTIKEYIIDKSIPFPNEIADDEEGEAPVLPPRTKVGKTQSLDLSQSPSPPSVPVKPRKTSVSSADTVKPRPAIAPRPRSDSQNQGVSVTSTPLRDGNTQISTAQDTNGIPNDPSQTEGNGGYKKKPKRPVSIPNTFPNVLATTPNNSSDPVNRKVPVQLPKPSPDVSQGTRSLSNDLLQAELRARVGAKRPTKAPRDIPAPAKDVIAGPTVTASGHDTTLSQPDEKENTQIPLSMNSPKLPPRDRRPKPTECDSNLQGTKTSIIGLGVEEVDAPIASNGHRPVQSAARPQDGTDAHGVAENPTNQSSSVDPNQKKDALPEVTSPKLPPRNRQPKLENSTGDVQGGRTQPFTGSQTEDIVRDDNTDDTWAPKLPPKSPGRHKKQFIETPYYVQPTPLHTSGNQPREPNSDPSIRKIQRAETLPKNYRPGEKFVQEDENVYEVPFAPPVAPVSPLSPEKPKKNPENPYDLIAKVPLDLSGLSVTDVSNILKNLNMAQYSERFENELIDGDLLKQLGKSDLESFHMESFHCKKLLNFIQGWRPQLSTKKTTT